MKNVKQLPLPILEADINKIKFLYTNGRDSLFKQRYDKSPGWRSFDIIKEYSSSPLLQKLPFITNWIKLLKEHTNIRVIKNSYISILIQKSSIDWHVDSTNKDFNKSIITAISTTNSFIEFEDAKYYYKDGYSYIIRSGNSHRVLNLNDDIRITLCTTPEGDYDVNVAA
tara:strand:- start:65 stop:571 length:507 start_codon:yes stop_codon:yes gene_type:complete